MKVPQARASRRGGKSYRWTSLKLRIRDFLAHTPRAERMARVAWRDLRSLMLNVRRKLTMVQNILTGNYSTLIDFNQVHRVDPEAIEYCALEEFDIDHYKGRVIGDDWDQLGKRFCDLDIYSALREVLSGKCAWSETVFFSRIADELSKGRVLWRCRTREDLVDRCHDIEILYAQIRDNGYMSQQELANRESRVGPPMLDDEITVSIGREGDLLFCNSAHRLCIAKLLKLESVPVSVAVRHPQWVQHVKQTGRPENIRSKTS